LADGQAAWQMRFGAHFPGEDLRPPKRSDIVAILKFRRPESCRSRVTPVIEPSPIPSPLSIAAITPSASYSSFKTGPTDQRIHPDKRKIRFHCDRCLPQVADSDRRIRYAHQVI
jgi:hypothetical protein